MSKLIFSDIDGTLINDQLKVTPKTRDAIQKQIVKGNVFIPTSARLPKGMMTAVSQILTVCPLIAYNGALALDEMGRAIVSRFFDAKIAADICRYVDEQDDCFAWNIYSGYVWYCAEKKSPLIEHEEKIVNVKATPASLEKIESLPGVHKALIMAEKKALDRVQQELIAKFPQLSFVRSLDILLEVVLKGVSKASAVKIMADEYKVSLKDCIAFGDNYNDEEMLEEVGHPYLMENAPQSLQRKFGMDHVTLDNNHDGIAHVLEKF